MQPILGTSAAVRGVLPGTGEAFTPARPCLGLFAAAGA